MWLSRGSKVTHTELVTGLGLYDHSVHPLPCVQRGAVVATTFNNPSILV